MKILILLTAILIGTWASAASAGETVEASGKVDVRLRYMTKYDWTCEGCSPYERSKTASVKSQIYVAPWGEGKAKIGFSIDKEEGCGAVQVSYTGLEMSNGNYELYSDGESGSVGEAIVLPRSVRLILKNGLSAKTFGRDGYECEWTLARAVGVNLRR